MAVPKRRQSHTRTRLRRQQHDKVSAPNVIACANCSAPCLAHRVCPSCGFYKGRAVVKASETEDA